MRIIFPLLFLFFCGIIVGQDFELYKEIPFRNKDVVVEFPFTGGFNAPQLSEADFNNDGLQDLYVFDRVGDVHLTFLNTGIANLPSYSYAPEYATHFPVVQNWVLLRDYDGDGIQDLFAYSDVPGIGGLRVHKGIYREDTLSFDRIFFDRPFNLVYVKIPTGAEVPLFISTIDYPAIDDVDCDGDLDILTFNLAGGFIEFYANQSVELGFERDSLLFEIVDNCWGGVFESGASEIIDLASEPGTCFRSPLRQGEEVEFRHTGSTLLTLDMDNDGDKELIVGDITFDNLNLLTNGGDCDQAWLSRQEVFFPAQDVPVDLPVFPVGFYLDLNNDGRKDLLAAPNTEIGGEDVELMWWYENTATNAFPEFRFRTNSFLVDRTIDLGTATYPAFVDYNADGLIDLVVGNMPSQSTNSDASLFLFENQGSAELPEYVLTDENYLGASRFSASNGGLIPRFRDLDGDGDRDLLLGLEFGRLIFAENLSGPDQPLSFGPWQTDFARIDVGLASVPEIYDYNGDGLNDLLVGERSGNINYFPNIGDVGSPAFDSLPAQQLWGAVDTREPGFFLGYSAPFVFEDEATNPILITGTQNGNLERYAIDASSTFEVLDEQLGNLRPGEQTGIDLANIDADPFLELVVGNLRGGIAIYHTDLVARSPMVSASNGRTSSLRPELFPIPTSERIYIRTKIQQRLIYHLYDSQGRKIEQGVLEETIADINLSGKPAGVYWLSLIDANAHRFVEKIIVH